MNRVRGKAPLRLSKQPQLRLGQQLARIGIASFGDFDRRVVRTSAAYFGVAMQGGFLEKQLRYRCYIARPPEGQLPMPTVSVSWGHQMV